MFYAFSHLDFFCFSKLNHETLLLAKEAFQKS